MWEIEYYEDSNGRLPVKEFIDALSVKERTKVALTMDLLEEFGISLGMFVMLLGFADCQE